MTIILHPTNDVSPVKIWLNSKIRDRFTSSKNEPSDILIPRNNKPQALDDFYKYYTGYTTNTDEDVLASDKDYINILKCSTPDEIQNDIFLNELNNRMEQYVNNDKSDNDNEWVTVTSVKNQPKKIVTNSNIDEINILIPHNTNRYHTNHLFKQMVDLCHHENMIYTYYNDDTNECTDVSLITPEFKSKFYEFCFKNSQ